jgi:hypothetical protein
MGRVDRLIIVWKECNIALVGRDLSCLLHVSCCFSTWDDRLKGAVPAYEMQLQQCTGSNLQANFAAEHCHLLFKVQSYMGNVYFEVIVCTGVSPKLPGSGQVQRWMGSIRAALRRPRSPSLRL